MDGWVKSSGRGADKGDSGVDVNPGAEGKTIIQSRKDGIVIFWLGENGSHLQP